MTDNKNIGAKRTAMALSAAFGGTRERLAANEVARDMPIISLYKSNGYLDRQISLDEALKLRNAEGPVNEQYFPAMLQRGVRLKDGRVLRLHSATNFE